jgi:hypothetical protein
MAYFANRYGRWGYLVTGPEAEVRLLQARRRADALFCGGLLLSIAGMTFAFPGLTLLPAAAFAIVIFELGLRITEAVVVGPARRDLPLIEDRRPLPGRLRAAFFGTAREGARSGLCFAAGIWFLMLAGGLLSGAVLVVGFVILSAGFGALWLSEPS